MHHKSSLIQKTFTYLALVLVALFVLFPIWEMVYLAFDGGIYGTPTSFRLFPIKPTLSIFSEMWKAAGQNITFLMALRNSMIVSLGAALLSVVFGASMAYAFARFRFPGRRTGLFGLLAGTLLPPVALMTPLFLLVRTLNIQSTLLALTIVYTSFAMPFAVWNMRAAFQAVPKELEEAAFLDGAGNVKTFWYIDFPLALPAIGIAGIFAFLIGYSEFAMGWMFVTRSNEVTLAMTISGILIQGSRQWSMMAAISVLMSIPVVVVFIVLQKAFLERMLLGDITA
jgi:arabinogalactan oligomer/maltooligosaccharide transport system permease protein